MTTASVTLIDTHKAIPKEKGLPGLGCLPQMAKDPLAFFRSLTEKSDGIIEFRLPRVSPTLVTDPHLIQKILINQTDDFRKSDRDIRIMGALLGNGLVTNVPNADHKIQRKLIQPGFHFRRIQAYADTMIDYSARYIDSWGEGGIRDVSDDMFKLTMYIVSKTLFDTNMEDMESGSDSIGKAIHEFQHLSNKRFNQIFLSPEWLPTPKNIKVNKIKTILHQTISNMIEGRRNPDGSIDDTGDLMSMLLNAKYDDGSHMSTEQVMDELLTLFVAGHETTSNTLTWTLYLLAKHPEIQRTLHQELDQELSADQPSFENLETLRYTEMVIKESMRILPSVWTITVRQANTDTEVGDYMFPQDKPVFISPFANHHNPRYFPQPERFDPERFSADNEKKLPRFAYIPFGAGPRVCIGNSFAMMEAKIIIASILQHYEVSLCPEQAIETQPQITLSNKGGMKLNIKKRK